LIIHYSFDETSTSFAPNTGSMKDDLYGGNKTSVIVTNGKLSNAASFNGSAVVKTSNGGICPVTDGEARTLAAWVNTTVTSKIAITGTGKNGSGFSGALTMCLDAGTVGAYTEDDSVSAADAPSVADGQWHHVAMVLPHRTQSTLGELRFYVDGVEYSASASTRKILTHGGTNSLYVGKAANNSGPNFIGDIDDFAFWGSALSAAKVGALRNAAVLPLAYDAFDMEQLFDLFNDGQGLMTIGDRTWTVTNNLNGQAGQVIQSGNAFAIVLDDNGNGVRQACSNGGEVLSMDFDGPDGQGPDCKVDLYDLAKFSQYWMDCTLLPAESCL
jgi:hypothetical protein